MLLKIFYSTYQIPSSPSSFFSPRNIRTMTFLFSNRGFDNLMWKEKSLWFNLLYLRDDLSAIWIRTSSRKVTRLLSGKWSDVVKISFTAIPPDKAKSCSVYLDQVICTDFYQVENGLDQITTGTTLNDEHELVIVEAQAGSICMNIMNINVIIWLWHRFLVYTLAWSPHWVLCKYHRHVDATAKMLDPELQ